MKGVLCVGVVLYVLEPQSQLLPSTTLLVYLRSEAIIRLSDLALRLRFLSPSSFLEDSLRAEGEFEREDDLSLFLCPLFGDEDTLLLLLLPVLVALDALSLSFSELLLLSRLDGRLDDLDEYFFFFRRLSWEELLDPEEDEDDEE